jgi:hypothetical protein
MRDVPWLDRSYMQSAVEGMSQYGMKMADAVFAAAIGSTIVALEKACMPIGVPRVLVEYSDERHPSTIARCYRNPAKREGVEILVAGLCAKVVTSCERYQLFHDGGYDVTTLVTLLGAHEERHRLQFRTNLRSFTPFCNPGSDTLLQGIVGGLSVVFKAGREAFARGVPSVSGDPVVKYHWSNDEFDAQTIERVVMHHAPLCTTIDEIARLVLYQPTP